MVGRGVEPKGGMVVGESGDRNLSEGGSMLVPVVVLPDGETYGSLDGSRIVFLTPEQLDAVENEELRVGDVDAPAVELNSD